jgi:uncharacterized protein (UPF0276 family)
MATTANTLRPTPRGAGVGLRLPHLTEVVATRPRAAWFEIHPENFLANPHATELLIELTQQYPVSVHTVGVSVGSAHGVDTAHLERVRALVNTIDPFLVSGHLAWSTHEGEYLNDLLPLPYNGETLRIVADHVDLVQQRLGRPFVVENPSSYVGFTGSTLRETDFLAELVHRTGCQLLCDVSNVYLSARNLGYDPIEYLDAFPARAVAELHLGGFAEEADEGAPGETVLIDTHGTVVDEGAWNLYRHAIGRFGAKPTLIEWDNDLPSLATLLAEASTADGVAAAADKTHRAYATTR